MTDLLQQALDLPVAERIRLVTALYISVDGTHGPGPLSDAQIKELERRLADYERNPDQAVTLEQLRERIHSQ